MGRAFLGEAELTEREGAVLLALAGTVFSFTAVAYRAVDTANDWQFLAYRGGSTASLCWRSSRFGIGRVQLTSVQQHGRP